MIDHTKIKVLRTTDINAVKPGDVVVIWFVNNYGNTKVVRFNVGLLGVDIEGEDIVDEVQNVDSVFAFLREIDHWKRSGWRGTTTMVIYRKRDYLVKALGLNSSTLQCVVIFSNSPFEELKTGAYCEYDQNSGHGVGTYDLCEALKKYNLLLTDKSFIKHITIGDYGNDPTAFTYDETLEVVTADSISTN